MVVIRVRFSGGVFRLKILFIYIFMAEMIETRSKIYYYYKIKVKDICKNPEKRKIMKKK